MSTTPTFNTQLIGQTEKTLNAILGRLIAPTGLTEPQWVTLTVAVTSGGDSIERRGFVSRIAASLKINESEAHARTDELAAAHLLEVGDDTVTVTDAGRELQGRIRGTVAEITQRMWGDLPAEDLQAAGRVLTTVLERATAELAKV